MALLRKDLNKEDVIENFRPLNLCNAKLNIFARVLAKRLARVVDKPRYRHAPFEPGMFTTFFLCDTS